MKRIAIIGYGHMGKALKRGLLLGGFQKENIFVSNDASENKKVAAKADTIIIAVKPKKVYEVVWDLRDILVGNIVISTAAAVTVAHLKRATRNKVSRIIRIMPNLPVAYGQGVVGLFASKGVSIQEKKDVIKLFARLGTVIDCKSEKEIEGLTVLSGSGPALAAYAIAMLAKSGRKVGVTKEVAERVAFQTFAGTLTMLQESRLSPTDLQKSVATKGGVTEEVIKDLETQKVATHFAEAIGKGYDKIKRIKDEL